MKWLRMMSLLMIGLFVIWFFLVTFIDNAGWAFDIGLWLGLKPEYALNLGVMVIALQALFFTSDWFYEKVDQFINWRLKKVAGWRKHIYLGFKLGVECLMALPKRTILFVIYLMLVVMESIGLISKVKDYAVMIVFIIAVDRVTKIWKEEKHRFKEFSQKIKQGLTEVQD